MQYFRPTTLEDAVAHLRAHGPGVTILAGGTDLVVQIRAGLRAPEAVMDIKRIAPLSEITRTEEGGWRIGAAVSGAEISAHAGLCADWPGLVEGVGLIGSMQVQSRATPVGNLCNASPAADSVPAMIAAGATVYVLGPNGMRKIPVEEVAQGPGKTSLRAGELVTSVTLPRRAARSADAYLRFTPRAEMDIAVAGAAVNLTLDDSGRCTFARVALGAVAPKALLVPEAGAALVGTMLESDALRRMAAAVTAACAPIDDKRGTATYRTAIAPVLARRAVALAQTRAAA
ncbi:xanthine dehydrogenase family protein subunit M [Salipiger sp. P9]|uniref:FAD binding domain-containing protein n=1 Tax=Salipiger pentaromativorans TaxID=2943193 RepID=UPI00215720BE|nr:xanthine dehydrogenase family protein subunit M [Salipiger pentaromativorans]MCR8548150.1 xanthine dehydrogenase family protein subunit M [Salipiger pentaromativorans]